MAGKSSETKSPFSKEVFGIIDASFDVFLDEIMKNLKTQYANDMHKLANGDVFLKMRIADLKFAYREGYLACSRKIAEEILERTEPKNVKSKMEH